MGPASQYRVKKQPVLDFLFGAVTLATCKHIVQHILMQAQLKQFGIPTQEGSLSGALSENNSSSPVPSHRALAPYRADIPWVKYSQTTEVVLEQERL